MINKFLYVMVGIVVLFHDLHAGPRLIDPAELGSLIEKVRPVSPPLAAGMEAVLKVKEAYLSSDTDIAPFVKEIEESKTEIDLKRLQKNQVQSQAEKNLVTLLQDEDFFTFFLSEIEKIRIMLEIKSSAAITPVLMQRIRDIWPETEPQYRGNVFDHVVAKSAYKEEDWEPLIEEEIEELRADASVFNTVSWNFSCANDTLKKASIDTAKLCVNRIASRGKIILGIAVGKTELVELKKVLLLIFHPSLNDVVTAADKDKIKAALLMVYPDTSIEKALKILNAKFEMDAGY
jgi:hypothetical protein